MDFSESPDDLQANLVEYHRQLDSVLEALSIDPQNNELITLHKDLKEVISLTNDLIKYKQTNSEYLAQDANHPEDAEKPDTGKSVFIGRTCIVLFNGKQKYGEVTQVKGYQPTDLVIIEILGSREPCTLALKDLRLLEPPLPSQCKPGSLVQALYSCDGRWYDCIINRRTESGYIVTYKDYNTSEEVQNDRIRLKTRAESRTKEVKEIVTPAGYIIPENLIIKKTDTDKEKMRKKKLVQSLKKQQKAEKIHEEATKRADSWRKFQQKSGIKNKIGYMTGKRGGSMLDSTNSKMPEISGPDYGLHNTFIPKRKLDYTKDMF
ncbi:hypothetical protein BEWA_009580 [Theileria equi strain WA]|uniref:Tudor domain-containing protein n=1 Tax=Theileria equi strain WA TaxID=1537102 RepID=L0B354_THEEQ|nr:hypothetical protein BEWA_009580 [Theileria equi strain WA]AFZ81544.1 hypothetical protein BEWA_009580 [Theileria equi strain WA]|eukprot:XP_004831210.1 hypothetical protein BEWA_009580 [Theileria equi strain WA]